MNNKVYSCLKMLEIFRTRIVNLWNISSIESVGSLQYQYSDICKILKENLSEDQFRLVQKIEITNFSNVVDLDESRKILMQRLMVATDMTIAYLRSLDMTLDKELSKEKSEVKKQRGELETQRKELESLKRIYEQIINLKEGMPELLRSRIVEETKKSHRGIEENTNKNTKSQNQTSP